MAITVAEIQDSRTLVDNESIDFVYIATGSDDESAVRDAVIAAITSTSWVATDVTLYWDRKIRLRPIPATVDEENTKGKWLGTAHFVRPEDVDPDAVDPDGEFSFEVTGLSAKITQSLETIADIGISPGAPNFKGSIGVDGDGKVNGADIIVPQSSFSIVKDLPEATVNANYRTNIIPSLVGKTNNTTFWDYSTAVVLLEGVSGSQLGFDGDWRMTFRFLVSPDETAIQIGDVGTIDKAGWDYLWVLYDEQQDASAKKVVKRPVAAYVERVYERGDFSQLGL